MLFSFFGDQNEASGSSRPVSRADEQPLPPPKQPLSSASTEPFTCSTHLPSSLDLEAKRPPIPKVAVVVAGAAFALTVGLTALVFPFVRQAAKLSNRTQFIAHKHSSRPLRTPRPVVQPIPSTSASNPINSTFSSSSSPSTSPISSSPSSSSNKVDGVQSAATAQIWKIRAFNDKEEDQLWGTPQLDDKGEELPPVSPLMGLQALGIATAIVLGTAGLGAWGVSRALGVDNMTSFNTKVREMLAESMPDLVESVNRKIEGDEIVVPEGVVVGDDLDEIALDNWINSAQPEER